MIRPPAPLRHDRTDIDSRPTSGFPTRVTADPPGQYRNGDPAVRLRRAVQLFEHRFGRSPTLAAAAPGRVNLIGEHTDYNHGFVLPMAIDRQAIALADPANGRLSTFLAIDLDQEVQTDLTRPLAPLRETRWANYALGVADQFIRRGFELPNLDLALTSTVPIGSGLASSAAVEVAVATLLEQLTGAPLDPIDKALLCRDAEHAFPATPCGIMDMLVACSARPGHALLIDCRANHARPIPLPPPDRAVLLIADTGVRHDLASGAYADRRTTCELAAARLGLDSLRDATPSAIESAGLTETEHKRALHVVLENRRTLQAARLLRASDLDAFGRLMFESHDSLRYLYEVTCPELDTLVEEARLLREQRHELYGARMTGGGFGGCAIVLCAPSAAAQTAKRLQHAFAAAHRRQAKLLFARPAGPASRLALPPVSPS